MTGLPNQPTIQQIRDQARHGDLVETGRKGEIGTGERAPVAHEVQDEREVVPSDGLLIGRPRLRNVNHIRLV